MKIYNPSGFDSKLTGSFTGSFKGDGSNITSISSDNVIFNFTAISSSQQIASDVTGSFTSLSSSLESRISDNESFSSSLDATYATDAELAAVSASLASELLKNTTDTLDGDLTVTGTLTAQEFHTELVSASILFDSGSTKFGDSIDDIHQFTGSLKISSSIYTTSQTFTPQDTTINSTNTSINSTYITVGNNTTDNVYIGGSTLNTIGGKVGIGTTTLNALLTISGSTNQNSANPGISLTNSDNSQTVLFLENTTTRGYELAVGGSSNSVDPGSFYVYDATATLARFIINSSGNVGIGQTPSSIPNWRTLEIKGLSNGSLLNFEDSGSTRTGAIAMNDASSLMRFQTFTDADITFEPNNSEAMRVTGDGKVGIGTNNPDADRRLHIKNTDDVRGILIENTFTGSYAELHLSASREYRVGTGGSASDSNAQDNFYIYDRTAAQHRITLNSSGDVGIGTSSPDGQLTVKGTTQTVTLDLNANPEAGLSIMGLHTTNNVGITVGKANSTKNSGVVRYHHNTDGGNDNYVGIGHYSADDILNITSGGSVGIGTTTPLTDLHVNNQSSDAQVLVQGANKMALHQDAAWNSNILLGCYYDGSNVVYGTVNRGAFKIVGLHDSTSQPQTLSIYGANGGAAGSTVTFNSVGFSQDEDGNVGIGTTTPRVKLDVRGSASIGTIGLPFTDAYTTSFDSLQVGDGTVVWGRAADSHFSGNYYVKNVSNVAQDTYINSLPAQDLWLDNGSGDLKYRSAATGTAGTQVSLTTRFTITNSGVVKIGAADDTPNSTQFALAIKGVGDRTAYFDGSSAASVWWGVANTPQFAIDSVNGGGATFWTHVSGTWAERMRITSVGAIEIKGAGTTVNGNAFITNTNTLATFGSTQSSGVPKDMAFYNGAERMRIQATTGYVGIGTSSPSAMLDIVMPNSGGATRQDIFRLLQLSQNTLSCYMYGGSTDLVQLHVSGTEQNLSLTTGGVATATTATGIHLRSGGNVGIGTTSPFSTAKLQVKTDTDRNVAIQTGTLHTTGIKINAFNDAANTNIPLELNGSLLSLKTGESEKIRILANGNVGIGTTNPSSLLHLYKASGDPMLNIQAVSGGDPGITFTSINNRTGNIFYSDGTTNAMLRYDHADTSFKLYAHNTTVVDFLLNETTSYFPTQNVGIGTTNPVPKFHLVYSGGSYANDADSGFINQADTGRATQRIRSITDQPAELFFDVDGGIRWDISVRNSSSGYKMNFYPQGATVGYANVSSPTLQLEQDGDVYIPIGNVGIGVTTTSYRLEVSGGFAATAITETSALKFKENITPLSSQLEIINKLNPVNFDWKEDGKKDFGFIADEVEEIIPELVSYKDDEVHGLHYSKLTPILVKALQEQQTQIEVLKQEIKKLKEI